MHQPRFEWSDFVVVNRVFNLLNQKQCILSMIPTETEENNNKPVRAKISGVKGEKTHLSKQDMTGYWFEKGGESAYIFFFFLEMTKRVMKHTQSKRKMIT